MSILKGIRAIAATFAMAGMTTSVSHAISINEFRVNSLDLSGKQYIELLGDPGETLENLSLVIIGPGGLLNLNQGLVRDVIPIPNQALPLDNPLWVVGDPTMDLGLANLLRNLNFPLGASSTIMLVRNAVATIGQDLDTNNDGVLDLPLGSEILDSVGLVEPLIGGLLKNKVYSPIQVNSGLLGIRTHAYIDPNGTSKLWIGNENLLSLTLDTPGLPNLNSAPTDITLSNNRVAENSPAGTIVGTLSTADPNSGQTHTYSFAAPHSNANGKFVLNGNQLQVAAGANLDHENASSVNISVRSQDSGNGQLSTVKNLQILIDDEADQPQLEIRSGDILLGRGATLDFGTRTLLQPPQQRGLTLKNSGDANLMVSTLQLPSGFEFLSLPTFTFLTPGESKTVTIRAAQNQVGLHTGQVLILTNDINGLQFSLNLTSRVTLNAPQTSARHWLNYQ